MIVRLARWKSVEMGHKGDIQLPVAMHCATTSMLNIPSIWALTKQLPSVGKNRRATTQTTSQWRNSTEISSDWVHGDNYFKTDTACTQCSHFDMVSLNAGLHRLSEKTGGVNCKKTWLYSCEYVTHVLLQTQHRKTNKQTNHNNKALHVSPDLGH